MEIEHYNNYIKIEEDAFAWRYMSFSKIYDLLFNNEIYFTRLDVFNDPLEGLSLDMRTILHFKNISKFEDESDVIRQQINTEKFSITLDRINKWQQGIYASCWYLTETPFNHHESLAMWNLYCDSYSFAFKISFKVLLNCIAETLEDFHDAEIIDSKYGKIDYLSLIEDFKKQYVKQPMPALIKDKGYKHENEVRFLLLRNEIIDENNDRKGIRLKLKQKLSELSPGVEILCHPEMDKNVFDTFKPKFDGLGVAIKYSSLLTKKVVLSLLT